MTDATATPEKPAAEAKEAPPAEKPFATDLLMSCTARFTRKAWDLFLEYNKDLNRIQTEPIRARLTARSAQAVQELVKILKEEGKVADIRIQDKDMEFTAPFAAVQTVIKHPQTALLDAVKL